jgi:predicted nucleotidyltransferase
MIQILKVIVGSQAHGLANEKSDFDYRGVFVIPTSEILKIGGENIKHTSWIEGNDDDTSWEIGKFLMMATKCNPTILETFLAPEDPNFMVMPTKYSSLTQELRDLFPYVWNSNDVKNAFIGYGINQRKKFFDNKDKRAPKYATAYLRTLYNCYQLLSYGTFSVSLINSPVYELCWKFKNGEFTHGEVIQACWEWETKVLEAFKANPDKKTNLEPVNEFLLKVRKLNW